MQDSILNTEVTTIDGDVISLEKYAGNVLLVVNVASKCGLTPQYEQLENIQKARADRGFWCWDSRAISFSAGSGQRTRDQNTVCRDMGRDVSDVQ